MASQISVITTTALIVIVILLLFIVFPRHHLIILTSRIIFAVMIMGIACIFITFWPSKFEGIVIMTIFIIVTSMFSSSLP